MISAFSLDFANQNLDNDALSDLFSISAAAIRPLSFSKT